MTSRSNIFWIGLFILIFLSALFWAKARDPFNRVWVTLKTADDTSIKCVVVLPKPLERRPVVVYAHGWRGTLMNDGDSLRQLAEMGLAVVSLDYDQTNETTFAPQFEAVREYLGQQTWADTNAMVWAGMSLGANRLFDFALEHPEEQPRLFIQISGAGTAQMTDVGLTIIQHQQAIHLHCPILLIHGDQDEVFPVMDTERLAAVLQTNGTPVELKILPGLPHSLSPEEGVIFRGIGEYCRTRMLGGFANRYHSIVQWQAAAPGLVWFCFPAALWLGGWVGWQCRYRPHSSVAERVELKASEKALRWTAVVLTLWATEGTAVHLVTPQLEVSGRTLEIARRLLVQPKERADFDFLAAQVVWNGRKLKVLLDHVELADYNRGLINWQVDNSIYRDAVLSPVITHEPVERLDWRRMLWEEFYPRIRHESSPEKAAKIVARHLRERVTIAEVSGLPHEVPTIWLRQITDQTGFAIIYVAALRSVGVPARLDSNYCVQFWNSNQWLPAPQPYISSWK